MAKYVVAGVTGRVGSVVATELLARHETVTVILRDEARGLEWTRRGADVVVGSVHDRAFVTRVVRGAAGCFILLPENVPADDFHGAVHAGGGPHVVMLSAIAASLPDGNGPAKDLHQ